MKIDKGTIEDNQIHLWAPLVKSEGGKFLAVLTDDSVDRDGEIVGKEAIMKIKDDDTYLAALMDHENKILGQVAEWTNRTVKTVNGHTTLFAEPKFFESNPNAKIIKGMLEEGAKMGVSIGAIVNDSEIEKIDGKDTKVYKDLELVEASFVAVPSNRHGQAVAIAKAYNKSKKLEKGKKKPPYKKTKKLEYEKDGPHAHTENDPLGEHKHADLEIAVEKVRSEMDERFSRVWDRLFDLEDNDEKASFSHKNKEVNKMTEQEEKTVEELTKDFEALSTEKKEADSKVEVLEKEIAELKEAVEKEVENKDSFEKVTSELEETKKELEESKAVHKALVESQDENLTEEQVKETAEKEVKAGKISVMRK